MEFTFDAEVFLWSANTAWHFVGLPAELADQVEAEHGQHARGFGAVKVAVQIGLSQWTTSLFPSDQQKTYVLPLKKSVRSEQDIKVGDTVTVHLTVLG